MLADEQLMMLTIVYSVCEGNPLNEVRIFAIEQFILKIKTEESPEIQQYQNILPSEKKNIANLLEYLNQKKLIEARWLTGNIEIADGRIKITAKGIDYIENPFDALLKEYPRNITASNIMNINTGGDVNIIESVIIQKNIQKFSDTELEELNDKLDELKNIISDVSMKESLEEIRKDLESNDKVDAVQKLGKFQNSVAKMRDAGTLIQVALLTYKIISLIFHLPNIGL